MTKNWLILGALTFSVGFGISLAIDKDIKRAALTGLITLPATATGVSVVEQRRKRQLGDVLSSTQARVEELTKKEIALSQQLFQLQTQVEDLKQKQIALDGATFDAIAKKQELESNPALQQTELDQLRTQISAQHGQKQDLEQIIATLETRKQQLEQESRSLQTLLQELRTQETALRQSLVTLTDERQQIEASLDSLKTELAQLHTQVKVQQQQTAALDSKQRELEEQQQQLIAESQRLQNWTQELRQQESELNQSLVAITLDKQQVEASLEQQGTQLSYLQDQIATQESQRLETVHSLTALGQQKRQLETDSSSLQNQIDGLEQQRSQLSHSLKTVTAQQQEAQLNLSSLQDELSQLQDQVLAQQQHKAQLTQELATLTSEKDLLEALVQQLQSQTQKEHGNQPSASKRSILSQLTKTPTKPADIISQPKTPSKKILKELPKSPEGTEDLLVDDNELENPTPSNPRPLRTLHRHQTNLGSNFMNSRYTKQLWEEQILPHWSHRDRPAGQRFLGSIRVRRTTSDQLLNIVGQNLQRLERVTRTSLDKEFYELEQNWLKILTFALSEYAYYYSHERFWQGFCKRLNINHNQNVEKTLRQVVDEGISLLGLVRARGGYEYVSTLWLQSGIPEQNLKHFAQLVQEIANEYGWWEIAHTTPEDLSQVLLGFCEEKHPQWGTLINFLKYSYSEEEAEPISGQLVQGIAIVAQELERQNASPQALEDEHQREELLGSYCLPHNFFLRNWSALIQVLTPKPGSSRVEESLVAVASRLFI